MAVSRTRNFATVVYPESAPENWLDILKEQHIPFFVSPLHDKDVNPDGEIKKAHYHVMLMYDGVKSYSQVEPIFNLIGGVGHEDVNTMRGYARYLCHLDNPEKHPYDIKDVIQFGGVDYNDTIGLPTDKYVVIDEMCQYCVDHHIYAYSDLLDYARANNYAWFRCLCDNSSWVMKEYLKSRKWAKDNASVKPDDIVEIINPKGENLAVPRGFELRPDEDIDF